MIEIILMFIVIIEIIIILFYIIKNIYEYFKEKLRMSRIIKNKDMFSIKL